MHVLSALKRNVRRMIRDGAKLMSFNSESHRHSVEVQRLESRTYAKAQDENVTAAARSGVL
jgi:hypothetical protein